MSSSAFCRKYHPHFFTLFLHSLSSLSLLEIYRQRTYTSNIFYIYFLHRHRLCHSYLSVTPSFLPPHPVPPPTPFRDSYHLKEKCLSDDKSPFRDVSYCSPSTTHRLEVSVFNRVDGRWKQDRSRTVRLLPGVGVGFACGVIAAPAGRCDLIHTTCVLFPKSLPCNTGCGMVKLYYILSKVCPSVTYADDPALSLCLCLSVPMCLPVSVSISLSLPFLLHSLSSSRSFFPLFLHSVPLCLPVSVSVSLSLPSLSYSLSWLSFLTLFWWKGVKIQLLTNFPHTLFCLCLSVTLFLSLSLPLLPSPSFTLSLVERALRSSYWLHFSLSLSLWHICLSVSFSRFLSLSLPFFTRSRWNNVKNRWMTKSVSLSLSLSL